MADHAAAAAAAPKKKSSAAERKRRREAPDSAIATTKRERKAASSASSSAASAASAFNDGDEEDGADDAGAAGGDVDLEVYAEGIPFTASEEDIRKFFRSAGDVLEVRAPTFHDTGRLKGYAHVAFATRAAAAKALELDGRYIGERFISVQASRPEGEGRDAALAASTRPRPPGCNTVFAKGLPYDIEEAAVKAAFGRFGAVTSVRLPRWQHTGRQKGHGYIQFDVAFAAEAAMKEYRAGANGGRPLLVGGRTVHLDWETGAPRQSFKTGEGKPFFKTPEAEGLKEVVTKQKRASAKAAAAAAAGAAGGGKSAAPVGTGGERFAKRGGGAARAVAATDDGDGGDDDRDDDEGGDGR